MRIIPAFLFLLFCFCSCATDQTSKIDDAQNDSLAIELNDSAMDRYLNYSLGFSTDVDSLEKSLEELNLAIKLDSTNTVFYSNKANLLLTLQRDDQAIQVLKQAVIIKPDFAEILAEIGFLHERKGENEIAFEWYQKALEAYDKRIEEERFVINSKVNKAFLLFFTKNEDAALSTFEKLLQEYPENEEVEFSKEFFENFDKEQFLKDFYQ